jgi:hypothetical protein
MSAWYVRDSRTTTASLDVLSEPFCVCLWDRLDSSLEAVDADTPTKTRDKARRRLH